MVKRKKERVKKVKSMMKRKKRRKEWKSLLEEARLKVISEFEYIVKHSQFIFNWF